MKRMYSWLSCLSSAAIFISSTSCDMMHEEAKASLEITVYDSKGNSYSMPSKYPEAGENIGYLLGEAVLVGGGGKTISRETENTLYDANPGGKYFSPATKESAKDYFMVTEELELVNKNGKNTDDDYTYKTSVLYLQVPVMANYYMHMQGGNYLHFGLGPYAAVGLTGHYKDDAGKQTIHFGSAPPSDIKRTDFGLTIGAGYQFMKNWDVSLGYDLGLKNLSPTAPDDKTHISGFSLNVGYIFK